MIEVTNNVFSTGRVRPNFFGQSRARMMSRGLMGLGGVEDYKGDSVAEIEAKIAGFRVSLARAKEELGACAEAGRVIVGILTAGLTSTECYLKWSGQVGWFEDRITEAVSALGVARVREKTAKAKADAAAKALLDLDVAPGGGDGKTGSKGGAITGGGALASIPTWAMALGGVVLLGGVTYAFMRMGKK